MRICVYHRQLALSKRSAVGTQDLTKSFRWNQADSFRVRISDSASDSYRRCMHPPAGRNSSANTVLGIVSQQHDIQELMRVLFDALERYVILDHTYWLSSPRPVPMSIVALRLMPYVSCCCRIRACLLRWYRTFQSQDGTSEQAGITSMYQGTLGDYLRFE